MLTVEEAKTKLCPLAARHAPNERCVAGDCGMWRFTQRYDSDFQRRAEAEFNKTGKRLQPRRGYCGLAGVPEF